MKLTPWPWITAIVVIVAATVVFCFSVQSSRARYSVHVINPGMVARLDGRTGEMVFLNMEGRVLGRGPSSEDQYAKIARPFDPFRDGKAVEEPTKK